MGVIVFFRLFSIYLKLFFYFYRLYNQCRQFKALPIILNLVKTDEQLISLALDGSQKSWVKLVKRYENLVYNYCLRMSRSNADAMDLMQEVFLAVYRNLPSYQGQSQFKGWLMRVTSNKTIDYLRHRNAIHKIMAKTFRMIR